MNEQLEFTDRYQALGMKYPSLLTVCRGQCEGTGWVPVFLYEGAGTIQVGQTTSGGVELTDDLIEQLADEAERGYESDQLRAIPSEETDERLIAAWRAAEEVEPTDDGWHFVRCPDCGGTGRTRGWWARLKQVMFWLSKKASFARRHVFKRPYRAATAKRVLDMQRQAPVEAFQVGSGPQPWDGLTPYGDRLDVPHPWWWNRRIALRVLMGRST